MWSSRRRLVISVAFSLTYCGSLVLPIWTAGEWWKIYPVLMLSTAMLYIEPSSIAPRAIGTLMFAVWGLCAAPRPHASGVDQATFWLALATLGISLLTPSIIAGEPPLRWVKKH